MYHIINGEEHVLLDEEAMELSDRDLLAAAERAEGLLPEEDLPEIPSHSHHSPSSTATTHKDSPNPDTTRTTTNRART